MEDAFFGGGVVCGGRLVGPYLSFRDGAVKAEGEEEDGRSKRRRPFTDYTRVVASFESLPGRTRWSSHPARGCHRGLLFGSLNIQGTAFTKLNIEFDLELRLGPTNFPRSYSSQLSPLQPTQFTSDLPQILSTPSFNLQSTQIRSQWPPQ